MSRRMLAALRNAALFLGVGLGLFAADLNRANAAEGGPSPERMRWSFSGPFGQYDPAQLQRGLKIYREVCASCHALSMVAFRNLKDEGGLTFSEEQAETIASEYQVKDGPNEKGEFFERPGRLSDYFPSPYPNEEAARAVNGGAYPPDFSTLAKARTYSRGFPLFLFDAVFQYQEHGQDYIHALLNGYTEPPHGEKPARPGLHYNKYFPGHWIAMGKPLSDGQIEYTDGTPTTVDQYSKDVAAFMTWAAEPHLNARKKLGLVVMFFLIIFAGLVYFTKKAVWSDVKKRTA